MAPLRPLPTALQQIGRNTRKRLPSPTDGQSAQTYRRSTVPDAETHETEPLHRTIGTIHPALRPAYRRRQRNRQNL